MPQLHSSGKPRRITYLCQLHLMLPLGAASVTLRRELCRALWHAGFTWPQTTDAYEAMRRSLRRMGLVKTGQLMNSIVAVRKTGKDGRIYYLAYPKGRRKAEPHVLSVSNVNRVNPLHTYAKPPTNNDVGFVFEFGAPKRGIQPRQWMRTANEESADDVVAAEFKVYDDWLKSKGF